MLLSKRRYPESLTDILSGYFSDFFNILQTGLHSRLGHRTVIVIISVIVMIVIDILLLKLINKVCAVCRSVVFHH